MIWFKSWTNHWWWFDMSTKDLDLISFYDLIWWFKQITTFSKLGQGIMCCWCFYCSWVELLISVIVPSLIFADTLAVRPNVHWWHFAHKTIVWNCCHLVDIVIWFVICPSLSYTTEPKEPALVHRPNKTKHKLCWPRVGSTVSTVYYFLWELY